MKWLSEFCYGLGDFVGGTPPLGEAKKGSRFEIFADVDGQVRWHLKGGNNEVIMQGEGYTRPADVRRAIKRIQAIVPGAAIVDLLPKKPREKKDQAAPVSPSNGSVGP